MDILKSEAFKGKFIKAIDLDDQPLQVVVESVSEEKVGDDIKPVLRMVGMKQGLVLNMTNSQTLTEMFGTSETSAWTGKKTELYPTKTQMGAKTVDCIRCRPAVTTPADDPFEDDMPLDL